MKETGHTKLTRKSKEVIVRLVGKFTEIEESSLNIKTVNKYRDRRGVTQKAWNLLHSSKVTVVKRKKGK